MKTAHVLAGANPAADRLIAALARAGQADLRITAAGPAWLSRRRIASQLRRFGPALVVAWSAEAAALIPDGDWALWARPGQAPASAFSHCQRILAATPAQARHLAATGFAAGRILVMPNIVPDLSGAQPAWLAVPAGARIVLALGPLTKAAGHDVLLAALVRLPGVHAVIAGDGPERRALLALATQAGVADRTHFLPQPTDPSALLAACDLLACPARQDVRGTAVLQAFSAAKPVVAAMAEALLDLLRDGTAGILVPGDSGIALAAGIEGMLANPAMAAAMAEAGRRQYETTVSETAIVAAWQSAVGIFMPALP